MYDFNLLTTKKITLEGDFLIIKIQESCLLQKLILLRKVVDSVNKSCAMKLKDGFVKDVKISFPDVTFI